MSAYAITDQRAGLRLLGSGLPALDSEVARLAAFLNRANWDAPSRCAEWSVHDVVAHLASGELYNDACLRDDLARLGHWDDDEQYNVEHVRRRRGLSHAMVHAEWLRRSTSVHDRWRAMAQETLIPTGVGPYSLGMQVWHIASEYATHADDIEVPVPPCARAAGPPGGSRSPVTRCGSVPCLWRSSSVKAASRYLERESRCGWPRRSSWTP